MSTEDHSDRQAEAPALTTPGSDGERIDPATGLPLPDPFPEYLTCPACGEAEVEVFCYQTEARCHNCGHVFPHPPPAGCGSYPFCKRGTPGPA